MTSAEDGGERDEMMRGHHKRYSSAASSQDGEYTTEADTDEEEEISEAGNQTDHLQDTSTSTVGLFTNIFHVHEVFLIKTVCNNASFIELRVR